MKIHHQQTNGLFCVFTLFAYKAAYHHNTDDCNANDGKYDTAITTSRRKHGTSIVSYRNFCFSINSIYFNSVACFIRHCINDIKTFQFRCIISGIC